jgi:hypothetical protein
MNNDENCPMCRKNIQALIDGDITCITCDDLSYKRIANLSVLGHIKEGLVHILCFEIICALASFKWAQERACKSGDYDRKEGFFYTQKYIKKD